MWWVAEVGCPGVAAWARTARLTGMTAAGGGWLVVLVCLPYPMLGK